MSEISKQTPNFARIRQELHQVSETDPAGLPDGRTGLPAVDAANELHEQLQDSFIDKLTGCYNLRWFEKFKTEKFDPSRDHGRVGLVFIDFNDLKLVNDTYGHKVGDELLKLGANYIRSKVRRGDDVVRVGGDEFVVVCRSFGEVDDFEATLQANMEDALSPQAVKDHLDTLPDGYPLHVKPSYAFGVAVFEAGRDVDLNDTEDLADARMYENKKFRG